MIFPMQDAKNNWKIFWLLFDCIISKGRLSNLFLIKHYLNQKTTWFIPNYKQIYIVPWEN